VKGRRRRGVRLRLVSMVVSLGVLTGRASVTTQQGGGGRGRRGPKSHYTHLCPSRSCAILAFTFSTPFSTVGLDDCRAEDCVWEERGRGRLVQHQVGTGTPVGEWGCVSPQCSGMHVSVETIPRPSACRVVFSMRTQHAYTHARTCTHTHIHPLNPTYFTCTNTHTHTRACAHCNPQQRVPPAAAPAGAPLPPAHPPEPRRGRGRPRAPPAPPPPLAAAWRGRAA